MDQLDVFYRAFLDYKKQTADDKYISSMRDAFKRFSSDQDRLEGIRTYCEIEEDWVEKIEEELVYVEKAVREERQFIRQNGEVLPIEKVKRVSNASVRHLARHSDMITHEPEEGEDLIPDKLYMVENLSDYAVYENRFLYMLLCYLRDFIGLRLQKILELGNTYRSDMVVQKDVRIRKRRVRFEVKLTDEDRNDPYSHLYAQSRPIIERIEASQRIVTSLLMTPLMKEVAKVPMLKPPITKTNVLKMNNNFRHSLELYHYVSSYTKDGYTIHEIKNTFSPLTDAISAEYSEVIALNTFLAYEYGNKMTQRLKERYEEEEIRRKEAEKTAFGERVRALKARLLAEGKTLEEYVLMVEDYNHRLEEDRIKLGIVSEKLEKANKQIEELYGVKAQLEEKVAECEQAIEERDKEIARLIQKYIDDMAALEKKHAEEIEELNNLHREEMEEQERMYEERIEDLDRRCREERDALVKAHNEEIARLNETKYNELAEERKRHAMELVAVEERLTRERKAMEEALTNDRIQTEERLTEELKQTKEKLTKEREEIETTLREEVGKLREDRDKNNEERLSYLAQLHGLRQKHGLITKEDDFSSKERFNELEQEYAAFVQLFKKQWNITKKKIRKDILWTVPSPDELEKEQTVLKAEENESTFKVINEQENKQKDDKKTFTVDSSVTPKENLEEEKQGEESEWVDETERDDELQFGNEETEAYETTEQGVEDETFAQTDGEED